MRTYGPLKLSASGDQWIVADAEPHVSIRMKQIFPRIPKQDVPPYRLSRDPATDADLDWFLQRYPMAMSDGDRLSLSGGHVAYLATQAEMERILLPDYVPSSRPQFRGGHALRPYQAQAIEVLRRRGSLLLGDEMGLGKTVVASGFLADEPGALPSAVVCDAHMQRQWREKIEQFTELCVHEIKKSTAYSLPKADVYIFRISQVSGWADIFQTGFFKSAVYDEPQSLRTGEGTAKGQACKVLSGKVAYRLGLTGTPIYNYGDEMWHVMRFIDPEALGDLDDFYREWCKPWGGKWRIKDPKALGTYLRERYAMLRRLKADVGMQLPKVSRVVEHIGHDEKAVKDVEDLARVLAIKASTASFVERGSAARELDIMVRQATGVAKAKAVGAFVRLVVAAGEAVLLLGWHRAVYDIWTESLADLKPAMYTGSESVAQKEEAKRRFLAGEASVLIMSLRSGAGLDGLQVRCSTIVFGELDWSPGIHHQCIGRLDREGQEKPVTAFFLVTDEGSDPPMMDVLGIKASEARGVIDPHLGVEVKPDDSGHLKKLVERYLDKKATAVVKIDEPKSSNT